MTLEGGHSNFEYLAIYDINVTDSQQVILFSKFGLFCYDTISERFVEKFNPNFTSKLNGKRFYFWSDEHSGIHIIDTKQKEFISIKTDPGKFVENLFVDSQENIWMADVSDNRDKIGLNRFTKIPSYFNHYLTSDKESLVENSEASTPFNKHIDQWISMRRFDFIFQTHQTKSLNHASQSRK